MAATARAIDMTNVRDASAINGRRKKPGDYRAVVKSVEDYTPKGQKTANQWLFVIALKNDPRATYGYYAGWDADQAWKVRNLAIAAGMLSPDKKARVKVDPNKFIGKEIGISLDDDEYEGKIRSKILGVFPTSELGNSDEVPAEDDDDDAEMDDDDSAGGSDDDEDLDLEDI